MDPLTINFKSNLSKLWQKSLWKAEKPFTWKCIHSIGTLNTSWTLYVIAGQPSQLALTKWEMLDWIEPTSWSHCKPQYLLAMQKNLCETVIAIIIRNKRFSLAMSTATISDVFYIVLYCIPAYCKLAWKAMGLEKVDSYQTTKPRG